MNKVYLVTALLLAGCDYPMDKYLQPGAGARVAQSVPLPNTTRAGSPVYVKLASVMVTSDRTPGARGHATNFVSSASVAITMR